MIETNTTVLAYIGDAVYESYIRNHVLKSGKTRVDALHNLSVKYVRADGQALAIKQLFDGLTPEEQNLVKRARNHKSMSRPKNADPVIYKWATALEALVGRLYLDEDIERLEEIISMAIRAIDGGEK
jgi:ribonuclease-3 family protein